MSQRKPSYHKTMDTDDIDVGGDDGIPETTRKVAGGRGAALLAEPDYEPASSGPTFFSASVKPSPVSQPKPRGVWELHNVPVLPEFHPLERTAVFVENVTPEQISLRVSDILRQRSIEAHYEDEKAKVKCTTTEGVEFRIRLYRGRGSYSHGIIVEVQRRFGASTTFMQDTKAILDAAQGKATSTRASVSSALPEVSESEEDYSPDAEKSLAMVKNMMENPGVDSMHLALQTLTSLADPHKMGLKTAKAVSASLISTDESNIVGAKVLALIIDERITEDAFGLRSMALGVLANAVQVTKELPRPLYEQLRPILIKELEGAQKSPRSACMAARALEWLLEADDNKADLYDALETAREAGATRHAALEQQAKACLSKY